MSFSLAPEAFVQVIYRAFLGRGRRSRRSGDLVRLIRQDSDPTAVVAGIMASDEYRDRVGADGTDDARIATLAGAACAASNGAPVSWMWALSCLGPCTHAYDPLRRFTALDIVGFDPLEERITERAASEGADGLILLPYAIGDGREHTLHVNDPDATSSLYPLNPQHNACFRNLGAVRTIKTMQVQTYRLR